MHLQLELSSEIYTSLFIRTSDRLKKRKYTNNIGYTQKAKQKEHIDTYTHIK